MMGFLRDLFGLAPNVGELEYQGDGLGLVTHSRKQASPTYAFAVELLAEPWTFRPYDEDEQGFVIGRSKETYTIPGSRASDQLRALRGPSAADAVRNALAGTTHDKTKRDELQSALKSVESYTESDYAQLPDALEYLFVQFVRAYYGYARSPDPETVRLALDDLGETPTAALLTNLRSSSVLRGRAVAFVLGEIGDSAVVKPLLEHLKNHPTKDDVTIDVLDALGKLGDSAAIVALRELTESGGSDRIRREASRALVRIVGESRLIVEKRGPGIVRSTAPLGMEIDCGSTCSFDFPTGAEVKLEAIPDYCFKLGEFSCDNGDCARPGETTIVVHLAADTTCVAEFDDIGIHVNASGTFVLRRGFDLLDLDGKDFEVSFSIDPDATPVTLEAAGAIYAELVGEVGIGGFKARETFSYEVGVESAPIIRIGWFRNERLVRLALELPAGTISPPFQAADIPRGHGCCLSL